MTDDNGGSALSTIVSTVSWPIKAVGSRIQDVVMPQEVDIDGAIESALEPINRRIDTLADDIATRVSAELGTTISTSIGSSTRETDAAVRKALKPIISEVANLNVELRELKTEIADLRTQIASETAKAKVKS